MKDKVRNIVIAAAIFIIIAVLFYELVYKDKIRKSVTDISLTYDHGAMADFYTYNGNIFYLTKDALQLVNLNGDTVWSDTFNMASASMVSDGGNVAVMEKDGRNVRVYNAMGIMSNISLDNAVSCVSLNSSGMTCVVSKGDTYDLSVYNTIGERIFDGNFASDNGYPICVDISDDGGVLAVGFLDVSDVRPKSRICFYYVGENNNKVNQSADSDYMFASFIEEDALVGKVSFMEENRFVSISDKSIKFARINPSGAEKYIEEFSYEIDNKITAMDLSQKNQVCVAFGDAVLNAKSNKEPNTVVWFDTKGKEIGSYKAPKAVEDLSTDYDATILTMGKQFNAVTNKGKAIWEYDAIQDVKKVVFCASQDDVLLVCPSEAYSVNFKEKKNMEEQKIIDNQENEEEQQNNEENKENKENEEKPEETTAVNTEQSTKAVESKENTDNSKTKSKDTEKKAAVKQENKAQPQAKAEEKAAQPQTKLEEPKAEEKQEEKTEEKAQEQMEDKPVTQDKEEAPKAEESTAVAAEPSDTENNGPVMPE